MRRTKKRGLDIRICFLRIGDKIVGTMFPSLYMIKGVITRNMPFFKNLTIKRWVFSNIIAHAKKSRLNPICIEYIQNPGGNFRNRPIIKS
jgi:hypothetical protein